MKKDSTTSDEGKPSSVSPVIRLGKTIVFKFEGNLRARVIGYEIIDDKVWLNARVCLGFKVPFSQVVSVEPEE